MKTRLVEGPLSNFGDGDSGAEDASNHHGIRINQQTGRINQIMSVTQKINATFTDYWQISRQYSKFYLMAQATVFAVMFSHVMANYFILNLTSLESKYVFISKGILEGTLFLGFSHYFLRSWLKRDFINKGLNFSRGFQMAGLLLLVSVLHAFLVIKLDAIPVFGHESPDTISITIDGEEIQLDAKSPGLWSIAITNQMIFYFAWCLGYIFWHAAKSKRELQKQMQEVRIQQLTNQLNPHFLFNAFNSIRAMIFEDKDKAADLITQLSELFRTHLQAHLKPSANLEEEWRIAQQYLDIEKVRLEERMQISCTIAESLWKQQLPTLTLLTLIENAVKHGISPNAEPGFIRVTAIEKDNQRWSLRVENSYALQSTSKSTQTGLKNTRQRLQLMFGDNALIRIEDPNNVFAVVMELPFV